MKPFISVIMPAYNAKDQIENAISSIKSQTMEHWELIVVDDCSTDDTPDVVEEWCSKDPRIILIRLDENRGPGYAKNCGLSKAAGKYITFLDADDWVDKDAFAVLSDDKKENVDVVIAGYCRDICDARNNVLESNIIHTSEKEMFDNSQIIRSIVDLDQERLFSFAWNKLYKTELIRENNIQFSNKKFGEDYDFNISYFPHCQSMRVLDYAFYHYIKQNSESLTEKYVNDFFEINRDRFEKMCDLMIKYDCFNGQTRAGIMTLYIKHVLSAIARLYDKRGNITNRERYRRVRYMLSDPMSVDVCRYARGKKKNEKVCNAIFKTKLVLINLIFGRALWLMQTRGKHIYEKIK